jgi:hypothetical protein
MRDRGFGRGGVIFTGPFSGFLFKIEFIVNFDSKSNIVFGIFYENLKIV